ncbi:hypothetical protein ALC57_05714 [Trachymyrmex cornetzi]|uniref:DNA-directed DNA polymerase n=1 Tax=Trachymyrmex cornetzi TaxID=471704 RepID=A0A151JA20_9HYME|nr:hypothetical protein ALC57_05714 [Trachymyrmex cornetzi]
MRAGCHFEVPRAIMLKKAVVSVKSMDNACFAWSVVAALYPAKSHMYTDTDSLIYRIECEDVYETIKRDIARFDTSDYSADNAYGMSLTNKKVPGLMKDENNGALMTEFVGLRAKMYPVRVNESLKKTFGPNSSANYYRGQLSIAYKKQGEHILDYIGIVKDLVTAIIEGDQFNLNRKLTHVETHLIESYALEAFYEGFPSKYRVELKAEGYTNFTDAFAKATTIHKRLEKAIYKNSRNSHEGNLTNTNGNTQTRILQRDNHHGPTDNTNAFDGTRKICTYSKNFGHLFHECRKRQYHVNNPRFDNNNNVNNNNNHNNNSLLTPSKTGNQFEASANGTTRGQGNVRPVYPFECTPQECTSSDQTPMTCLSSNSNRLPFEVP